MKRYMQHIIRSAEIRVEHFIKIQVKDKTRLDFGAMRGEIYEAKPTVYAMSEAVAVYCNVKSRYYHDRILKDAMNAALDFVARTQRDDGSFDYPCCNFHSTPDTSFCFKRLIAGYRVLIKYEPREEELIGKYKAILLRSLKSILLGGFHTPNHRWAIAAALMQGVNLVEDNSLKEQLNKRAFQYLAEGIDGDEEGEYAERSTGNYNAVVNNAMMAMYEESKDEYYLGFVERNLKMMMYYFDPDDTIFTQNSTRQDQGKAAYPNQYFYQYLYLATKNEDPVFGNAAHKIIRDNMERGDLAPQCLYTIMLHREMEEYEFTGYGFLNTYRKYFKKAGVMRVRNDKFGYSILKGKSAFTYIKFKDTLIYLKIGESYCDIRNFIPQNMEVKDKEYVLSSVAKGWYYLPFKEKQATSDWWKMNHSKRELQISSELKVEVIMIELENGMEFHVKSVGLDKLPLRVEICIPTGAVLEHEAFYMSAEQGRGMVLKKGYLTLHHGEQKIKIGPGYGTHEFGGHYSGEEFNENGFTIYLNDYTPYERTFTITCEE
ncbi:hypothetical protein C8E03_102617 [Lachnotalea glycerini]|uniref:Heparinase II/III-like protein n=1 Tax=Lachnotalea glycerini TaxID=1763509 RepID=A0A255I3U3_9FIRM|nr:hypothetical protein [Lachnotalea glycerini]PXV93842.1 hypothetical protein C8E03_102617 [Lachnotalea glycerini]RDY30919.1 hypothetical protein CG710_012175 [Lachnotalea glycerini]